MKNTKIERILKEQERIVKEFGRDSEEYNAFYKSFDRGAWAIITAYCRSNKKGFDEIVFTNDELIWSDDIDYIINFCKEAKIGWFVYGSGYSGTMDTIMHLVEAGAKVGKFVVKEYTDNRFGEVEVIKVPGIRINL